MAMVKRIKMGISRGFDLTLFCLAKRYLAYFGQNVIMDKLTSILEYILITNWDRNVCATILEYIIISR